jgi:hypothetical protein
LQFLTVASKINLEESTKNEEILGKQAAEFQSTIAEQEKLSKQLQIELDEAKKIRRCARYCQRTEERISNSP